MRRVLKNKRFRDDDVFIPINNIVFIKEESITGGMPYLSVWYWVMENAR